MKLSRISIKNFRNFKNLDVILAGDIVVVGENRVGKSNLLYALRLIFDATLPDSARQLTLSDFWDGLETPDASDEIIITVEIEEFDTDPDVLCLLTDFRLDNNPEKVRLTYAFRPIPDLDGDPSSDEDYEFICFGGESEKRTFGHGLRRRIAMDLLPALRDAEGDLANWRRSPLRPLIENAFAGVDRDELEKIKEAIEAATEELTDFDTVEALEAGLQTLFLEMSGPKQDVRPTLGFGATDISRVYRNVRLLIDEGRRGIADASLGSANIVFLTLKALELKHQIAENKRDHTFFAIEEPEAHLHPHLQRSVYRHLFGALSDPEDKTTISIFLTTHSPHIASIAPLRSILLLKDVPNGGTIATSTAGIELTDADEEDLARYLDITRAEMLFSRGIILVEGDAEKFLIPTFAQTMSIDLDKLGITVCSVAGTNFRPYVKFLSSLRIPFAVITDWDPQPARYPLGMNRAGKLAVLVEGIRTGEHPAALTTELDRIKAHEDEDVFGDKCEEFGIFTNGHTLEVDLFKGDFADEILDTLSEHPFGGTRKQLIANWRADNADLDVEEYLKMIEVIGKGRFAQRLASRIEGIDPPIYIESAINSVVARV